MSIIRDRFVTDAGKACLKEIDYALIGQMEGLTYRNDRKTRRHRRKVKGLEKKLAAAMKRAGVEDYAALRAAQPDALLALRRHSVGASAGRAQGQTEGAST